MSTIQDLEQRPGLSPRDIEAFIATHDFPLVEGTSVTFVFHGAADAVLLRHWVHGLPSSQNLRRLPHGDLWYHTMELPEGSRVEYKIELVRGDRHQLIQDPLNPHVARDPYGANSVVHAAGYVVPDWTQPDPEARPGSIEEIDVGPTPFGDPRHVRLYRPARFRDTARYPLLVVHDGADFLRYSGFETVLNNLIHRLEIPPMLVAFVDPGERLREYANDPRHGEFLTRHLVPFLEERLPLVRKPSARALLGASFGAVASLSAAWQHPGVFGNLFLLSGSFAFTDIGHHDRGPVFDPVVDFVNAFRKNPGRPAERVFLACGMYESLIYYNRSLVPFLQSTGMEVRYEWARDGHNWDNWRDRLRSGLSWLFPGPLWLVYE